ncbi:hypothetical protein PoB_002095800 [Plakobranchus ocellatus]|uniref:Uncharacterized protein n=1 Tax=Plakobranchus ocellatus TaxID=259542 RepID=A0AAV3ZIW8_9GAST|nr:hypothetical protein PoB_002095800 [Plakobranchus ocellatus]
MLKIAATESRQNGLPKLVSVWAMVQCTVSCLTQGAQWCNVTGAWSGSIATVWVRARLGLKGCLSTCARVNPTVMWRGSCASWRICFPNSWSYVLIEVVTRGTTRGTAHSFKHARHAGPAAVTTQGIIISTSGMLGALNVTVLLEGVLQGTMLAPFGERTACVNLTRGLPYAPSPMSASSTSAAAQTGATMSVASQTSRSRMKRKRASEILLSLPDQDVKGPKAGLRHFVNSASTIMPSAALPPVCQEVGSQWSPEFSNGGAQRSNQNLKRATKRKTPMTVREVVPTPSCAFCDLQICGSPESSIHYGQGEDSECRVWTLYSCPDLISVKAA